jgi:anti-sigma factor RsiW
MIHWVHKLSGRVRRLAATAAEELSPAGRPGRESALTNCPACRREAEAYRRVAAALRRSPRVGLTAAEATAFLPEVNRRIDLGRAGSSKHLRPGLREMLWDHPRLSLASACTAALLLVGLALAQMQMWSVSRTTSLNGVEVVSVDVDENASVMVFQAPGSALKVIWVFEDSAS